MQIVHDCPYSRLTQKYPDATIAMWCDGNNHIFEISAPEPSTVERVTEELSHMGTRQSVLRENGVVSLISKDCDCMPGASSMMSEEGIWPRAPTIYREGWENYQVLSHDKENISKFVRRFETSGGKVKLVSLKPLKLRGVAEEELMTSSAILSGLTDKQIQIMAQACVEGYFDEPSRTELDTLAKKAGLARSTYAEHLRKAQAKLMGNLCPLIHLAAETVESNPE